MKSPGFPRLSSALQLTAIAVAFALSTGSLRSGAWAAGRESATAPRTGTAGTMAASPVVSIPALGTALNPAPAALGALSMVPPLPAAAAVGPALAIAFAPPPALAPSALPVIKPAEILGRPTPKPTSRQLLGPIGVAGKVAPVASGDGPAAAGGPAAGEQASEQPTAEGRWLFDGASKDDKGAEALPTAGSALRSLKGSLPQIGGPARRTGSYALGEKVLKQGRTLNKGPARGRFLDWYHSLFFFSPREQLSDNLGSSESTLRPFRGYDSDGQRPLDGYRKAQALMFARPLRELGLEAFNRAHEALLSRRSVRRRRADPADFKPANSEGIRDSDIGRLRSWALVYSPEEDSKDVGEDSILHRAAADSPLQLPNGPAHPNARNPFLVSTKDGHYEHAPLKDWRVFADFLSPGLKRRLRGLKRGEYDLAERRVFRARQEYVRELLAHAWSTLDRSLVDARTNAEVIDAVGRFYYAFVSIHPYADGTGRLGRLLAARLLAEFDLPPPLWTHMGVDIVLTTEQFLLLFRDAVALSESVHRDLLALLQGGFDARVAATPYLDPGVAHFATFEGRKIIPEEFMTWLAGSQIQLPGVSVRDLVRAFWGWKDDFTYYDGGLVEEGPGIRLATPLFRASFNRLSPTQADFDAKMREFYGERPIYRGYTDTKRLSDKALLAPFLGLHEATAGMGVPEDASAETLDRRFARFNEELLRDNAALRRRIVAHVSANTLPYWRSGLISFTDRESTAKSFADGAHMGQEWLLQVKSSVKIEARERRVAAIETARSTPQLRDLSFALESEHVLVAGVDPEAVVRVSVKDVRVDLLTNGHMLFDGNHTVLRTRVATRLTHNRVRLTETNGEGQFVRAEEFEIQPNRTFRRVSHHVPTTPSVK